VRERPAAEYGLADLGLSPGTVGVHHAVLDRALKRADRGRLITTNPAADVEHRPRVRNPPGSEAAKAHCWTADEARVVTAAKQDTPQMAASIYLALDAGAEIRTATKQLTTG